MLVGGQRVGPRPGLLRLLVGPLRRGGVERVGHAVRGRRDQRAGRVGNQHRDARAEDPGHEFLGELDHLARALQLREVARELV